MPWVRLDENALDHPKVVSLTDGAFRLWCEGLSYCQRYLTDGVLTGNMPRILRYHTAKRRAELVAARLWDISEDGLRVHDYLHWNDSKETVLTNRDVAKRRVGLLRDPELRERIRERDGDDCRYCRLVVSWTDRRGAHGGTYDHIDPGVGNTYENLVVCCRGCNSRKGRRTPDQAGMILLPIPSKSFSESDLDLIKRATSGVVCSSLQLPSSAEREGGTGETSTPPMRAGAFCEWYAGTHERLIKAGYIGNPRKDYEAALLLVAKFSDIEIQEAATMWFGQRDSFAVTGTRTVTKFASRASALVLQAREVAS